MRMLTPHSNRQVAEALIRLAKDEPGGFQGCKVEYFETDKKGKQKKKFYKIEPILRDVAFTDKKGKTKEKFKIPESWHTPDPNATTGGVTEEGILEFTYAVPRDKALTLPRIRNEPETEINLSRTCWTKGWQRDRCEAG